MPIYTIEIPANVEAWITESKKVKVQTFIQNEVLEPLLKEYENKIRKDKQEAADSEVAAEVTTVKKTMKIRAK